MDMNVLAFKVVQRATSETRENTEVRRKRTAAGFAGARARAEKLSPTERREIAVKANRARWRSKRRVKRSRDE